MNKTKIMRHVFKWLGIAVATPIVLFLLLAIALYIPAVQNFLVQKTTERLSQETGLSISIERVRLAFPLDLAVHGVQALDGRDTLVAARSLRLDVAFWPLFEGRADIEGVGLYDAQVNTKSYLPDLHIRGRVGELSAASHGVEWNKGRVLLDHATLADADLHIALSDTAAPDTTAETPLAWVIDVPKVDIRRSTVRLSLPGDSLHVAATLGKAALRDGRFDLGAPHYALRSLSIKDGFIDYVAGKPQTILSAIDLPKGIQTPSVKGWENAQHFDMNHITLSDLTALVDTFSYDAKGVLRMGIRGISFRERCGLAVHRIAGSVYMDSALLSLPSFLLRTEHSTLDASVHLPWKAMSEGKGGNLRLQLKGKVGHEDVLTLASGFVEPQYAAAYPHQPLTLDADIHGNIDHLVMDRVRCSLPGIIDFSAKGYVAEALQDHRRGSLRFSLATGDLSFVRALLPADVRSTIGLPKMKAEGNLAFSPQSYQTDMQAVCGKGSMSLRGELKPQNEAYKLSATSRAFPLGAFLPSAGMGNFSGKLNARGQGFDFLNGRARLQAEASVEAFGLAGYELGGLDLKALLNGQQARAIFSADNTLVQGEGTLEAQLGDSLTAVLKASLPMLALQPLTGMTDSLTLGADIDITASADKHFTTYGARGSIANVRFLTPRKSIPAKDVFFAFGVALQHLSADIAAGDLNLQMSADESITSLTRHATQFMALLEKQWASYSIDQNALKAELPDLRFRMTSAGDNPLANILRYKGITFDQADVRLHTAAATGIDGHLRMRALNTGSLQLDSIGLNLLQDTAGVKMKGRVHNYTKRNPHKFDAGIDAYLLQAGAGAELTFRDAAGEVGVQLGVRGEIQNGGLNISLYPEHPIIAYRGFTVNKDNYIFINQEKLIRANVDLLADDGTGLKVYGEPADSANDITLSINRVNLGELSTVLPYLPPMSGSLSGDFHLTDKDDVLSAMATIQADNFAYDGTQLGNVGVEAIYLPMSDTEHHANAYVSYEGQEVLECEGTYFTDGSEAFEGTARLHSFPLPMLNSFMSGTEIALKGFAAGEMEVRGTLDRPIMNGQLDFDTAHIYSDAYGFDFRLDERPVPISGSRMKFQDFGLYSTGKEPLVLNGTLDMSDFGAIALDMQMKARNYELINTRRKAQSLIFGKVYVDFDGTLTGTLNNMFVRGKLDVLDRTDMTYILKDSPLSVDERLNDLVQFVSFEDSTIVEEAAAPTSTLDMTLGVSVSDAAQFHCDLSADGESYVDIEGGGDLTLRMTQQGEMRLTGRFTTHSGEMKYALPIIPLKTFKLEPGSYVEFTGEPMNPTLNITAKERVKAVVTENDRQRSVAFDVGVAITKPLDEMGLEFLIEAPEDLSIQNQIAAMSAEQRSKAAVTMLATGMYLTDENMMSGGFKANNALNAFLQSEIQNIAGSALRTIDINLGVESGTSSVGTGTTDYSFQFAKRFWNNRISVIVGGKVSTGADAENSAASIIDNVSVEYRLDKSSTRYVRVFYDRDTQDPLEGQLTKTGAGLVLRKKTNRLGELFIFRQKKDKAQ